MRRLTALPADGEWETIAPGTFRHVSGDLVVKDGFTYKDVAAAQRYSRKGVACQAVERRHRPPADT
ncbi:hypothetical protein ETD86_45885 [Nonomuraea turkmeniaca]|uniref:Uncharacterized protein n=1 Tax=Nonomuraea turkmeniaca TaxID=103838 RepID=A0A5S4EZ00_9ACTN|nr:hypothetical protein [Nonomuraea turkmeniaca]TMR08907.1 hypothetical protein ETD86_45885 [Nonomuraea turkmeniaca]